MLLVSNPTQSKSINTTYRVYNIQSPPQAQTTNRTSERNKHNNTRELHRNSEEWKKNPGRVLVWLLWLVPNHNTTLCSSSTSPQPTFRSSSPTQGFNILPRLNLPQYFTQGKKSSSHINIWAKILKHLVGKTICLLVSVIKGLHNKVFCIALWFPKKPNTSYPS